MKYNSSTKFDALAKDYKATKQKNWEADVLSRHSNLDGFKIFESAEDIPQWAREQREHWTADQQDALNYYTSHEYSKINEYLRDNISAGTGIADKIGHIANAIDKSQIDDNIVLWRGASFSNFTQGAELQKLPLEQWLGQTIDDKAFVSTSMLKGSEFSEKEIQMQVLVPKASMGAYLAEISDFQEEQEMLLQKGSAFQILGAETRGGKYFIKVLYGGVI